MKKWLTCALLGCALFTTLGLEARAHIGINIGGGYVERRVVQPVYVEEYYYETPCCPYGYHAPVGYRRVYTRPAYQRVYVEPRPFFSFSFGR